MYRSLETPTPFQDTNNQKSSPERRDLLYDTCNCMPAKEQCKRVTNGSFYVPLVSTYLKIMKQKINFDLLYTKGSD